MKSSTDRLRDIAMATFSLLAAMAAVAGPGLAATPATVAVQGRLLGSGGAPVPDGDYLVAFRLYAAASGGQATWSEQVAKLPVVSGRFAHALGTTAPLGVAQLDPAKAGWLGVQVGNEPELPRARLHTAPYVARAASADSLLCTACLSMAALKADGDLDLSGQAVKVKLASTTVMKAAKVTAKSFSGDGSALTGIGLPAGQCPQGKVVVGIDPAGKLVCAEVAAVSGTALEKVSGGLLTTKIGGAVVSTTTPKPIDDNNPIGTVDEIAVPDMGVATGLSVSVKLNNSDLSGVQVLLYDPENTAYTLHDKGPGKAIDETYGITKQPVSGDLGKWIGKNPKGVWRLRIIDGKFLNNGVDGALASWSVNVLAQSSTQITAVGAFAAAGGFGHSVSAGPPFPCTPSRLGSMYWDSKSLRLQYCDGDWRALQIEPLCGNKVINGGEECDDGNTLDGDGCTHKCLKNVCGDGVLWPGVEQCDDGNLIDGDGCDSKCKGGLLSCKHWKDLAGAKTNGKYLIDPDGPGAGKPFEVLCDMTTDGGGWTLVARFANADTANWMDNSGSWWYTRTTPAGDPLSRSANLDMYSPAFHSVKGTELRISRTSNPDDTGLLVTKNNCLAGQTFRAKITSYGNFQNGAVWGDNSVKGSCDFTLGSNWNATNGFKWATCNGNIGGAYKLSFWSDWSSGDGAVMMIGGGGSNCNRADHGIGVTEANAASFNYSGEDDFGDNGQNWTDGYALNLWVR